TILRGPVRVALQVWIVALICLYYVYFWSRWRQTLAMRAWRILLVREDGAPLTGLDALRRLVLATLTIAPFGAGLLWALLDRDGLTWYDRLSHTRPVLTTRPGRSGPA
ncbi:MAG: RDD family protein, partial [Thiohalocapsa sp.]